MEKNKLTKILSVIVIILVLIIVITCGVNIMYRNSGQMLTEEQAIQKAKQITEKIGKTFGNIKNVMFSDYTSKGEIWSISTDNSLSIDIHAYTGKLSSIFDYSIDDTKVPSTTNKEEAEKLLKQTYLDLGYKEGEYELATIEKNMTSEDTNIWQADFCKKYDGVYNKRECVRIGIIPEKNHLMILVIFDYKFENNKVVIKEEEAIEIAKNKAVEFKKDKTIEKIETKLDIERTKERTSRKAWVVEITFENSLYTDKIGYSIDATTGEIIKESMYL